MVHIQTLLIFAFFPLFTLSGFQIPFISCSQFLRITSLRTPHHSSIPISHTPKTICVLVPKTLLSSPSSYILLSVSFLPTSCVAYSQDQFPQNYSILDENILFKIPVKRDKCVSGEETEERYSVLAKGGINVFKNVGFDYLFVGYFGMGLVIAGVMYGWVVRQLEKGTLFRRNEWENVEEEEFDKSKEKKDIQE